MCYLFILFALGYICINWRIFIELISLKSYDTPQSVTSITYILRSKKKGGFDNTQLYKRLARANSRWHESTIYKDKKWFFSSTGYELFINRGRNLNHSCTTLEDIEPYLEDPFDSYRTKAYINLFPKSETARLLRRNQGSSSAVKININLLVAIKSKHSPR